MTATATRTGHSAPRRHRHIPGEPGLWVFLLGDMIMFSVFFGFIAVLHGRYPRMFRASQQALHPDLGLLNTLLLLTASALVARGLRQLRGSRPARTLPWALLCALGFAAVKGSEYALVIHAGHTPSSNDFFMYYFVFTGIHLAHLAIGTGALTVLIVLSRRPALSRGQLLAAEGAAAYWHMVDLLWLVLFPLFYLVA
ncbi:cytochrome c oxidase subunit 3 [Streptomyces sp. WAC07094]|uniref:cytochrome c oxidase subunit 3 n=1 Tax=Streptomyces sp. WAC07094 TaxID=3072183 RepID=UPI002EA7DAA0|nr:cytochrome c oxidase subunit 3 [Streptomyces sp. WAC07094]